MQSSDKESLMFCCPACSQLINYTSTPYCSKCGWHAEIIDNVVILVPDSDRHDPIMGSYFGNYDQIADDDLANPILNLQYVQHQAENMLKYVGDVQGLDILDLGCGQGVLTKALAKRGARQVVAVDISVAYLRRLTNWPNIIPLLANAENLPFRKSFDVMVSTDVMEHVLNVGSFLVSINRALRVGGLAVIRVPLAEDLIAYSLQAGCKYRFVHLRSFNKSLLKSTLQKAGFRVEAFRTDGFSAYTPQPFWLRGVQRRRIYNKLQAWALKRMKDPSEVTTWNSHVASLFMRPQEIVVVARKAENIFDTEVKND